MSSLTVLTYNIHHAVGVDGRLDVDRTAGVIAAAGADLVGLQEVDRHYGDRSRCLDELGLLADALGMTAVFGGTLAAEESAAHPGGVGALAYGNALLTPHRVGSWRNRALPNRSGLEPRALLDAVVHTTMGPVRFGVTHLGYECASARRAQVQEVCRLLDDGGAAMRRLPRVLVGDFNDTPDSAELAGFWTTFADSWPQAGVGTGATIGADEPVDRIDYVLHDAALTAVQASVASTPASDHLPVRVVLQAREESAT